MVKRYLIDHRGKSDQTVEYVLASDYEALVALLKAVQTDAGNWLHSELLDAIDKAVGESGPYRSLDDSGVKAPA